MCRYYLTFSSNKKTTYKLFRDFSATHNDFRVDDDVVDTHASIKHPNSSVIPFRRVPSSHKCIVRCLRYEFDSKSNDRHRCEPRPEWFRSLVAKWTECQRFISLNWGSSLRIKWYLPLRPVWFLRDIPETPFHLRWLLGHDRIAWDDDHPWFRCFSQLLRLLWSHCHVD